MLHSADKYCYRGRLFINCVVCDWTYTLTAYFGTLELIFQQLLTLNCEDPDSEPKVGLDLLTQYWHLNLKQVTDQLMVLLEKTSDSVLVVYGDTQSSLIVQNCYRVIPLTWNLHNDIELCSLFLQRTVWHFKQTFNPEVQQSSGETSSNWSLMALFSQT